jgi:hypothetical protein
MKLPKFKVNALFLVVSAVLLTFVLSCKKEDLPPKQLSAAFEIREVAYNPDFWDIKTYDTDSVSTGEVAFIASEPQADTVIYNWKVGTDSRTFQGKRLELDFRSAPEDTIAVQLTVNRWNSTYTTLLESRTASRTFYLRRKPLVLGTFEGYFSDMQNQKVVMKIQENFKHPIYYKDYNEDYIGLLISTNLPGRDTFFVANDEGRHYIFHRMIPLRETTIVTYAEYVFNRWMLGPVGEIVVDPKTRAITLNVKAREVATNKEILVKFSGKKVN